jgi:hypothetical protein
MTNEVGFILFGLVALASYQLIATNYEEHNALQIDKRTHHILLQKLGSAETHRRTI